MSASISNANSTSSWFQTNPFRQRQQDFQALGSALQSGDLDGAQKAFAQLQADAPPPPPPGGQPPQSASSSSSSSSSSTADTIKNDFQTLADALKSGNLDDAKKAFSQLQDDMKAAKQAHAGGHHHRHRAEQSTDAANANASSGQQVTFTITETSVSFTA
jgi:hypothetical protein